MKICLVIRNARCAPTLLISLLISLNLGARPMTPEEADFSYEETNVEIYVPESGKAEMTSRVRVKVLNEYGRSDLGTMKFNFTPKTNSLQITRATVTTNGITKKVPKDNIVEQGIRIGELGFDDTRQILVSFPNVQAGSDLFYELKSRILVPTIENVYSDKFDFGFAGVDQRVNYKIRSKKKLYIEINDPTQALQMEIKEGKREFVYNFKNTKPIMHQYFDESLVFNNDRRSTWVKVSTESSYESMFANMAGRYEKILSQPLDEEVKKAFLSDLPKESLAGISQLLARASEKLRYMGDWRGVDGGVIPRSISKIIETHSGDCKDLSLLTVRLLREMGIKAWVALVYRGYTPPELTKVPYFLFNHAIVYVNLDGRNLWLDPTNFQSYVEGIFEDIGDRKALILDPQNVRIESINFLPPENSNEDIVVTTELTKRQTRINKVKLTETGHFALPYTGAHLQNPKKLFEDNLVSSFNDRDEVLWSKVTGPELTDRIVQPIRLNVEWEAPYRPAITSMGRAAGIKPPELLVSLAKIDGPKRMTDVKLGVPSISKVVVNFKNLKVKGQQLKDCVAKSKWLDYSFRFSNEKPFVETITNIKKYLIRVEEVQTAEFARFQTKIKECSRDRMIIF